MLSQRAEEGLEKSAILMLAIGEEGASDVMKHLSPKELQRLGLKMSKTQNVSVDTVDSVMKDILEVTNTQSALGINSSSYIKNVLNKALGEEKASYLLDTILANSDTSGIEGLKWMDPQAVSELIKDEHPQIIATIMVHLEKDHCAAILNYFGERLRSDVVLRIATLEGVQPNAIKELNEVLSKLLSGGGDKVSKKALGGTRTAAEILNFVGSSSEKLILDSIAEVEPELSAKIQEEMFTFENLLDISNRDMQMLLRELEIDKLAVAMKGAPEEIKNKFFSNMSVRAADALRDEIQIKGAVRVSDVEAAQKEILKAVREKADLGQIQIIKGGEGAVV